MKDLQRCLKVTGLKSISINSDDQINESNLISCFQFCFYVSEVKRKVHKACIPQKAVIISQMHYKAQGQFGRQVTSAPAPSRFYWLWHRTLTDRLLNPPSFIPHWHFLYLSCLLPLHYFLKTLFYRFLEHWSLMRIYFTSFARCMSNLPKQIKK